MNNRRHFPWAALVVLAGICAAPAVAWAQSKGSQPPARKKGMQVSLQEMLAIALKHNPDVRAAEANVRTAEVELDRTRLEVVQKVIEFRQLWQVEQANMRAHQVNLDAAARSLKLADKGLKPRHLVEAELQVAENRFIAAKVRLTEIEAALPFLLGQAPGDAQPSSASQLIRDQALPKARLMLELRQRSHQQGDTSTAEVVQAQRQVLEWEERLADSKAKKIAVLERHLEVLEKMLAMVAEQHKSGDVSQDQMLDAELELLQLRVRLLELKGD